MNQCQLIGNLARDVEIRFTKTGKSVAMFTVAATSQYQQNGEIKEQTAFINVVAWGKLAESCGDLSKGSRVFVSGRISVRSYEKDGQKRYVTEVVADFVAPSIGNKVKSEGSSFDQYGQDANEDEIPF